MKPNIEQSHITLPLTLNVEELAEQLAGALDTPAKRMQFLKAFDRAYADYDTTLEMAQFFVAEIRIEHEKAGESISLETLGVGAA